MAFVENLDQFFETDDFAVAVVINTTPSRTINAIFETPSQSVELYDSNVEADMPKLTCKTSDLTGVRKGRTATINSIAYNIERVSDDGTGISTVYLKR